MAGLMIKNGRILLDGNKDKEVRFHGNHVSITHQETVEAFPSGHFLANPVSISTSGEIIEDNPRFRNWLTEPFVRTFSQKNCSTGSYEIHTRGDFNRDVIIFNCLDACFGQSLYKLFNTDKFRESQQKTIVIIHPNLLHYVPYYVDEIWLIKSDFRSQDHHLQGFHEFVTRQLTQYDQVELIPLEMSINLQKVNIASFTKTTPFSFSRFSDSSCQICLSIREDRMWLQSKVDQWLYLVWKKTGIKLLKFYLLRRERKNYYQLIRQVNQAIAVKWIVLGIGKGLNYRFVTDLRENADGFSNQDQRWCDLYANSHLTIGIHGSNMLIPSYLSGAYINLVPRFKVVNYSEDFLPRKEPVQRTLFMARNLPASITSQEISLHVVSILQGYRHGIKIDL